VLDHYDTDAGSKVWSADTIAKQGYVKLKKDKKKKKREQRKSTSSGSSSGSSRKRKKRSKSRKRSRSRGRKKVEPVRQTINLNRPIRRVPSRSPSIELVCAPLSVRNSGVREPKSTPALRRAAARMCGGKSAKALDANTLAITDLTSSCDSATVPTFVAEEVESVDIAQAGMAAAAALGFSVLPKPQKQQSAPAPGLRPSINSAQSVVAAASLGGAQVLAGRVCISYMISAKCELGSRCPDVHVVDPEEEMRIRARFKSQECQNGAACNRPGCLFRHPGEKFDGAAFIPEGQKVTLKSTVQGVQLVRM